MQVTYQSPCQDPETGPEGYCVVSIAVLTGETYVMFVIDGELQSIRRVVGDSFETVWQITPGELM